MQSSWLQIDSNDELFQLYIFKATSNEKIEFLKFEDHM